MKPIVVGCVVTAGAFVYIVDGFVITVVGFVYTVVDFVYTVDGFVYTVVSFVVTVDGFVYTIVVAVTTVDASVTTGETLVSTARIVGVAYVALLVGSFSEKVGFRHEKHVLWQDRLLYVVGYAAVFISSAGGIAGGIGV